MHKNYLIVLAGIVGILFGFYILITIENYTAVKIDPTISFEINPFELFSLASSIVLAIYVARTLSKANDLEKTEKELLINYLANFKDEFNQKIIQLLEQTELDSVVTNSNFKTIRKKIDSILSLSVEHKFIDSKDPYILELKNNIRDIWELFTDTPQKKQNGRRTAPTQTERLRLEQVGKIEVKVIEIEKILFQLSMKIIRK